ncbi:hypothetical protein BKA62DRAFT_791234 [Auriculariales sp. MPI-PUGE-AT-0066]|nr:hypothetical protein BKA62DRAFT_791234 [Auriculariales sp. MPI-PUGE-AT-0066]
MPALRRSSSSPNLASDIATFSSHPTALKRANTSFGAERVRPTVGSKRARSRDTRLFDAGTRHVRHAPALPRRASYNYTQGYGLGLSSSPPSSATSSLFSITPRMSVAAISVRTKDRVCASAVGPTDGFLPSMIIAGATPLVPILAQLDCPAVLAQVGLAHGTEFPLSSVVTISSQQEQTLRVDTSIYAGGVLVTSNEDVAISTSSRTHSNENDDTYEYSTALAPDFLTRVLSQHHHDHLTTQPDAATATTQTSALNQQDSLVILRFLANEFTGPKMVLVLACQFRVMPNPTDEGFVAFWQPVVELNPFASSSQITDEPPKLLPSPTIESEATFSPATPVPRLLTSRIALEDDPVVTRRTKQRVNLTIAIPSAESYLKVGNLGPGTTTPLSASGGLLSVHQLSPSPLPITPLDKVLHTPLVPPPINTPVARRTVDGKRKYSNAYWVPTPTEASYPASMGIDVSYFDYARAPTSCAVAASPHKFTQALERADRGRRAPSAPISGALASPWAFGYDAPRPFQFDGSSLRTAEL